MLKILFFSKTLAGKAIPFACGAKFIKNGHFWSKLGHFKNGHFNGHFYLILAKNEPKFDNIFNKGVKFSACLNFNSLVKFIVFLAQPLTRESMFTTTDFFSGFKKSREKAVVVYMLSRVRGWWGKRLYRVKNFILGGWGHF